jgi:hypothetical protein
MREPGDVGCSEILYRVILNRRHLESNGDPAVELFILRPQDEGKLSVFRSDLVSLEDCKSQFKKVSGTCTLHTGHVRSTVVTEEQGTGLDVIPDEKPDGAQPGHAVIINLPDPQVNRGIAERVASLLRNQCRRIKEEE